MGKKTSHPGRQAIPAKAEEPDLLADNRRTWGLILGILGLLALALGLKAWDERQVAERAFLTQLDAESKMLAARVSSRNDAAQVVLRLIGQNALTTSKAAGIANGMDAIVSLRDAAQSPPGSRLGDAAAVAKALPQGETGMFLTTHGDLVFVSAAADGAPLIALSPISATFSKPENARLTLRSPDAKLSFGGAYLSGAADIAPATGPSIQSGPDIVRAGTACSPVSGSEVAVCLTVARPLLSVSDILRIAIFGLLIAAPAMAILDLTRRLSRHQREILAQATHNKESDRILGLVMRGAQAGYWEWSHTTNTVFLSDGAAVLLGFDRSGLMTLDDLLGRAPVETHDRIREAFTKARTIGWLQLTFPAVAPSNRWI